MRKSTMFGTVRGGRQLAPPLATILGAVSLTLASLGTVTPVRAEIWCLRDFNGGQPVCVFPSARQCVAGVGAFGGVCERQSAVRSAVPKRRDRHPARSGPGAALS
jgi:hypothetical protein